MKRIVIWLCLIIWIVSFQADEVQALGNGFVAEGRQTFYYSVQLQDQIKGLIFDGEWGMTPTLAVNGRYIYAASRSYLDLFVKFKVYESKDLNMAGRIGLWSDFSHETPIQKTLGFVASKYQNSFLITNGGFDYSLDTKQLGYFVGIDYKLTNHTFFQIGWERFMSRNNVQGLTIGIRTDL